MEGFDEFKNILVGADESEGAQKAFQYAVKGSVAKFENQTHPL